MEAEFRTLVRSSVNNKLDAYWASAPDAVKSPYIILRLVRTNGSHTMSGPQKDCIESNVLVEVWADSYTVMAEYRDMIVDALDSYRSTEKVQHIVFEDLMAEVNTAGTKKMFRAGIGFAIFHRK